MAAQAKLAAIHVGHAHRPGHLATGVERTSQAERESGAIQGVRLLRRRPGFERERRSMAGIVVRVEVAVQPIGQVRVLGAGDGHRTAWALGARRHHLERVAVYRRPLPGLEGGGVGVAEHVQNLVPQLFELVAGGGQPRQQIGPREVIRGQESELHEEAGIDPLQVGEALEDRQNIPGEAGLAGRRE